MSIFGNSISFESSGGGGGADSGAYVGYEAPEASLGKDGDYYFWLNTTPYVRACTSEPDSNATVSAAGWEFTVNSAITVIGVTGLVSSSYYGTIKLAAADGTVLRSADVSFTAGQWVTAMLDEPITLSGASITSS